jgi:hypothetical protein
MDHFRILKSISFLGLFVTLASCEKTLDATKIEETIKSGITKQGGSSVKSVICPNNIKPKAASTFECVGVLDEKVGFAISVQQQDDQGNITWDASSVKGLLNISQLKTEFEQGLQKEMGRAAIDCGGASLYRPVKPGETFECQLFKREEKSEKPSHSNPSEDKSAKQPEQPKETIQVTIQPSGDINWQRTIKVSDPRSTTIATNSGMPSPDSATKMPPESKRPETSTDASGQPSAPPAQTAEEALNTQPPPED